MSMTGRRAVALLLIVGMLSSVVVAGGAALFASSSPDGLESVAKSQGFADTGRDPANVDSPLADYGFSGVEDEQAGFGISAGIGLFVTLGLGLGLFMLLTSRRGPEAATGSPTMPQQPQPDQPSPDDSAPKWPTGG
jgi:hypothetical protein